MKATCEFKVKVKRGKMRITINLLMILALFSFGNAAGQPLNVSIHDSTKSVTFLKKTIVPVSLTGLGIIIDNSNFEKKFQTNVRDRVGNNFECRIDNYLSFIPIVEMYSADILGVNAKKNWFDQTKYLLISNLISSTITFSLKIITNKERPNGSHHSLPSGHTTLAFTNACVLYNEFKDTSPILAFSGYVFSTTTGTFRMINNKHWLSDVLVDAGIGIISAELVYHFEPFKSFSPFGKTKNVSLVPQIRNGSYSIYFSYHFLKIQNFFNLVLTSQI